MEPLGDTVVALTLSDGCSTDTQMSVEYLMVVALTDTTESHGGTQMNSRNYACEYNTKRF